MLPLVVVVVPVLLVLLRVVERLLLLVVGMVVAASPAVLEAGAEGDGAMTRLTTMKSVDGVKKPRTDAHAPSAAAVASAARSMRARAGGHRPAGRGRWWRGPLGLVRFIPRSQGLIWIGTWFWFSSPTRHFFQTTNF
jgi:hypothetical protein